MSRLKIFNSTNTDITDMSNPYNDTETCRAIVAAIKDRVDLVAAIDDVVITEVRWGHAVPWSAAGPELPSRWVFIDEAGTEQFWAANRHVVADADKIVKNSVPVTEPPTPTTTTDLPFEFLPPSIPHIP